MSQSGDPEGHRADLPVLVWLGAGHEAAVRWWGVQDATTDPLCLPRGLGTSAGPGACCPGPGTPTPAAGQRGLGGKTPARQAASSAASCVVTMVTKASGPSQWPRPVECGAQHRGHLPPGDGFAATQSSAFYCCPSRRPVLMFPGWGSPEVPNGPHQPRLRLCAQLPVLPENPFLAFSSFWKLPASLGGEAASSAFKGGCVAPVGPIPRLLWGLCLFCRPLVLRAAAPPSWLGRPGPHGHILSFGVKMWTSFCRCRAFHGAQH